MGERLEKPPSGHRHDCDVYDFDPDKQLGSDKPCNCGGVYHTCSCGMTHSTRDTFVICKNGLKVYVDREGSLLEQRACANCESTQTVVLIQALSPNELRQAVRSFGDWRESFNDKHTGLELMHLWRVMITSGWVMTPDEWTEQQVSAALLDGTRPSWEYDEHDRLHALRVTDCPCYHCTWKRMGVEDGDVQEEGERRARSVKGGGT